MAKALIFIIGMCLLGTSLFSQRYYHIWPYGASAGIPAGNNLRALVDFSADTFVTYPDTIPINFRGGMAAICDSSGRLQLFTNGHFMVDGLHRHVLNGAGFNPNKYFDNTYLCYICPGCFLLLPKRDSVFLFLHIGQGDTLGYSVNLQTLYYSVVVGDLDAGFEVVKKNTIVADGLFEPYAVVKKGSGNDYWLIQPVLQSDTVIFYTIGKDTLSFDHFQTVYPSFPGLNCYARGINSVSPDGQKYVRFNNACGLWLYDLDRCNGMLFNAREIPMPAKPLSPGGGTEFSPNSRFLYFTSSSVVYQVDTEADVLQADTVAVYESFLDPFPTTFFLLGRQADGKIYINSTNGVKSMHRIEYPDSAGLACQVRQHSVKLAGYNAWVMHRYPNVWLGPADCGPVEAVVPSPPVDWHIRAWPNPAASEAFLEILGGEGHPDPWPVQIHNLQGHLVYQGVFPSWSYIHQVPVSAFSSGYYVFTVWDQTGRAVSGTLLIAR